jgi:MFS family permease
MLINNSVPSSRRGAVNGAAETAAGLGRLLAPPLSSPLFAWSLLSDTRSWPLNHHLLFWCNAGLALLALWLTVLMPSSISKPPVRDSVG